MKLILNSFKVFLYTNKGGKFSGPTNSYTEDMRGGHSLNKSLLKGVEGIFIPVRYPEVSARWYEEVLGFRLNYIEEEAAVMNISNDSPTVVCLVKVENHTPMKFPSNNFGVGKYVNFIPEEIEKLHAELKAKGIAVNALEGDEETKYFTFYDPDGNPLGACQ